MSINIVPRGVHSLEVLSRMSIMQVEVLHFSSISAPLDSRPHRHIHVSQVFFQRLERQIPVLILLALVLVEVVGLISAYLVLSDEEAPIVEVVDGRSGRRGWR